MDNSVKDLFKLLAAPFDPKRVDWRVGSTTKDKAKGMALAYVDARVIYDRLDEVLGPAGWQCRYPHVDKKTVCEIGIKVGDEWVWKANGAGDSDIEAEKGALSDALKRAAVAWGIGRYLYELDSPWVELKDGKSIMPHEYPRLQKLAGGDGKVPVQSASAPAALSSADKAAKALVWANNFVLTLRDVHKNEHAELVKINETMLDAARAYPEARAVLEKAGV